MAEIKTPIKPDDNDNYVITPDHTIADIARWILEEGWLDEILLFAQEEEKEDG